MDENKANESRNVPTDEELSLPGPVEHPTRREVLRWGVAGSAVAGSLAAGLSAGQVARAEDPQVLPGSHSKEDDSTAEDQPHIGYARYCVVPTDEPQFSLAVRLERNVLGPRIFLGNGSEGGYSAWLTAAEAEALRQEETVRRVLALTTDDVPVMGDLYAGGSVLLVLVAPNCWYHGPVNETYVHDEQLVAQWSEQFGAPFEAWVQGYLGATLSPDTRAEVVAQLRQHPQVAGLMWVPSRESLAPAAPPPHFDPCPVCGQG